MPAHQLDWQYPPPAVCRGGTMTIGNFDGVHRGHAALVGRCRALAEQFGGPAVVLTFDPHPLQVLRPASFLPLLMVPEDRGRALGDHGADEVAFLRTDPALLQLPPEDFFQRVLVEGFGLKALVEGEDFRFGHQRAGDLARLRSLCEAARVRLEVMPALGVKGVVVSSSRVRAALEAGDVALAADFLGRPHRLHGVVETGQRRGRTLGFPTANLGSLRNFAPGTGVYAVQVPLDGRTWAGAANVGPNPTFGEAARKVEVHLIDYEGDLYGRSLAVDFIARLRDTRKFDSGDDLREQLRCDVDQARRLAAPGWGRADSLP